MTRNYYLTDEWKSLRLEALKRDKFTCQVCGYVGVEKAGYRVKCLVAHHVVERKKGGPDNIDNLLTVCNGCHRGFR